MAGRVDMLLVHADIWDRHVVSSRLTLARGSSYREDRVASDGIGAP
jgi:hypothetical protein